MKSILSLALLLLATPVLADPAPPVLWQQKGPAKLLLSVDPAQPTVRLSTLIALTLEVSGETKVEVEVLEPVGPAALWQIVEKLPPNVTKEGRRWEQRFLLLPIQPGAAKVEPPVLRFRQGDNPWEKVVWEPITLRVVTRVAQGEAPSPRDITAIETLPVSGFSGNWWLRLLPLILLAGGALWVFLWFFGQPPAKRKLSAGERAQNHLARLAAVKPTTQRSYQQAHFLLAKVLRRFVQAQWGMPAPRLTTQEFLARVEEAKLFSPDQLTRLSEILTQCDLAKFCPTLPDARAYESLLKKGRAFVAGAMSPPAL